MPRNATTAPAASPRTHPLAVFTASPGQLAAGAPGVTAGGGALALPCVCNCFPRHADRNATTTTVLCTARGLTRFREGRPGVRRFIAMRTLFFVVLLGCGGHHATTVD